MNKLVQKDVRLAAILTTAVTVVGVGMWTLARRRSVMPGSHPAKVRPDMPSLARGRGLRVERAVTVMSSPEELYSRWRDLSRLPELIPHLESVTPIDQTRSRWVLKGPRDLRLSWEAELVADEPGRLIAWRSIEGADVDNEGSVRFTLVPNDRGTEMKVLLSYAPPAGWLANTVATLFGRGGDREIREALRRFKQQMEADEVAIAAPGRRVGEADLDEHRWGRV
ncbi:MAG TPA: SRPBCC family protein [Methylomirabilota bacterium]|jgi:uncharacterized membrane protein|nr:SRPBCC family protein [Methylomirabilota bacterium]